MLSSSIYLKRPFFILVLLSLQFPYYVFDVFPIKNTRDMEIFCTLALMKSTRYVQSFPNSFFVGSYVS